MHSCHIHYGVLQVNKGSLRNRTYSVIYLKFMLPYKSVDPMKRVSVPKPSTITESSTHSPALLSYQCNVFVWRPLLSVVPMHVETPPSGYYRAALSGAYLVSA